MFTSKDAFSGFSANDVKKIKEFYVGTLGMDVTDGEMGTLNIKLESGGRIIVYPKENHKPAEFTILNFVVDDIESAVRDLKNKGTAFEHYDEGPVKTDENGIFRGGGPLIAWFRDPAGNILSVMQV
jgi:predicted enzyme related to lactoylglutathione lyase